jgi:hypothetical protein
MSIESIHEVDDVRVWLDDGGGISIKAVTSSGDPVELSSTQARLLANILNQLADKDDD